MAPAPPAEFDWNPMTRQWWEVVRATPHTVLWTDTDRLFALETAAICHGFRAGDLRVAGELRIRSAKLGLTYEDRLKLRIRYVALAPETRERSTNTADLAARRGRLSAHAHVVPLGGDQWGNYLRLRDLLRESPAARAAVKRSLLESSGSDRNAYTIGKTDIVKSLIASE